jgi:hypothetical protein
MFFEKPIGFFFFFELWVPTRYDGNYFFKIDGGFYTM